VSCQWDFFKLTGYLTDSLECKKKVHLSTECENIPKEVCEKEVKHETRVVPKEVNRLLKIAFLD